MPRRKPFRKCVVSEMRLGISRAEAQKSCKKIVEQKNTKTKNGNK